MAILRNSLDRKKAQLAEGIVSIDDQLERLEEDIRRLKIDFDIYFNGGTKTPPHAARASLEARMSRIHGNRGLSYGSRYKLNALMSRYNSYRHLWRRRLKEKGEDVQ
ncbi:MAG: hypothetical protein DWQ47_08150 [Acidobacteria bacterium]|nr:MAG: hypothetical protein DWQ32_16250 [Acidobacteriota bacterium]REJ99117.1 MAG: hypothetical protein DWQ38_13725 [Acidobacteriota bacterium]REK16162.1 MAG: hypothetical protein DWQ43_03960 [Acidobacteriota bacterium]REK43843.1 MAG: hypothetical protein DWQ47_08150 [Acidobacteriota bacterium]